MERHQEFTGKVNTPMSGRSRKRLLFGGAALLLCGVVCAVLMTRSAPKLVMTLKGLETNQQGVVAAELLLSNVGPTVLYIDIGTADSGQENGGFLQPFTAEPFVVTVPSQKPIRVVIGATRGDGTRWFDYAPSVLVQHVFRRRRNYTLDIP